MTYLVLVCHIALYFIHYINPYYMLYIPKKFFTRQNFLFIVFMKVFISVLVIITNKYFYYIILLVISLDI